MNVLELRKKVKKNQEKIRHTGKNFVIWSGKLYGLLTAITVLAVAFFITSPYFFGSSEPINDSGVGEQSVQKLGNQNVSIAYRSSNIVGDYVELILAIEGDSSLDKEYEAIAVESSHHRKLSAKVAHIYGKYYVVQLMNIPNNWKQLTLAFGYEQGKETTAVLYPLARSRLSSAEEIKPLSTQNYVVLMTKIEEEIQKETIFNTKKEVDKLQKEIKRIEEKMKLNTLDIEFQSGEEQQSTLRANEKLASDKDRLLKEMSSKKVQIKSLQEQLEKIRKRRQASLAS